MANKSQFNYETFDHPYNRNLQRIAPVPQKNEPPAIDIKRRVMKESISQEGSHQIFSPFQLGSRVVGNQTFDNVWIQNWLKSINYKPRTTGLRIDGRRGIIDCQKIYTEDINVGNRTISVDIGGSIQQAIDNVNASGGGTVFLRNGTHTRETDLILYSHVYLQGQSADNCTLDFGGNAAGICVVGTNTYSTGTVTATNGSATITGSGTSWTSAMVGRHILLAGLWYPIAAVTDTTHITIGLPYGGKALAGATYNIATIKVDVRIEDVKITGSATAAIKLQYTNEFFTKNIQPQLSTVGIDIDDSSNVQIDDIDIVACGDALQLTNTHFTALPYSGVLLTTSGNGISMDTCTNCVIDSCFVQDCAGDGFQFTDCDNIYVSGSTSAYCGGQGYEFVSGNIDIVLSGCNSDTNTSDGYKLTATTDYCKLIGCISRDNGGWGVNVANANCDKNTISLCTTNGNSSGDISDSGTGTVAANNVT